MNSNVAAFFAWFGKAAPKPKPLAGMSPEEIAELKEIFRPEIENEVKASREYMIGAQLYAWGKKVPQFTDALLALIQEWQPQIEAADDQIFS